MKDPIHPDVVLDFWFKELSPQDWWMKNEKLDKEIRKRFSSVYEQASKGELFHWRASAEGRLAEIIALDQFPRNMFRGTKKAFETDNLALVLSQEAIRAHADKELPVERRSFLYMPFMHSESKIIHEEALKIFDQPGLEENLDFEIRHKVIIDRFGRYPHRNKILGRESTEEEIEFLKGPDSSF